MADRPALKSGENEITPEMIEAATDVLLSSGLEDGLVSRRYAAEIASRIAIAVLSFS